MQPSKVKIISDGQTTRLVLCQTGETLAGLTDVVWSHDTLNQISRTTLTLYGVGLEFEGLVQDEFLDLQETPTEEWGEVIPLPHQGNNVIYIDQLIGRRNKTK